MINARGLRTEDTMESPLLSLITSASGLAGCHSNCVSDDLCLSWGNQSGLVCLFAGQLIVLFPKDDVICT